MGYVSGNVPLGTSVSGWLDIIEGLLLARGWSVVDDQMPPGDPSGYRIFKPAEQVMPKSVFKGELKVSVDGGATTLNAVDTWNTDARSAWKLSAGLSRAHDLANGFSYFAEVGSNFLTIFFETTNGVQTPISFGVRLPDWSSPVYQGGYSDNIHETLVEPVCWVCEPHEGTFHTTHAALYAHSGHRTAHPQQWWAADGSRVSDSWAYMSHDLGSNAGLYDYTNFSPGLRAGVWSPTLRYGKLDSPSSGTYFRYVAGFLHTELPGVYRTNSDASDKVAILSDSRASLIAGYTRNYLVDNMSATDTSMKLTGVVPGTPAYESEPHFAVQDWPATNGIIKLGDEWIRYANRGGANGDEFTGLERGLFGTTPASYFGLDANMMGQVSAGLGEWWVKSGRACLYAGYEQP